MRTPPLIPAWLLIATAAAIMAALLVTMGCATMDYRWQQTRPASAKPWFYVTVADADFTCRTLGADPERSLARINACAQWQPVGCTVYVPENAPRWIVEHEEKHCLGFTH